MLSTAQPTCFLIADISGYTDGGLTLMSDPTPADPTRDRLLRHMAWANAALIATLAGLPDDTLALASPRNEWTVAMILQHLVDAADRYAARLEGVPRPGDSEVPDTVADLAALASRCAESDARIRAKAGAPDGPAAFADPDAVPRARSTVVAQAIHHATEHRAQIAAALSTNGIDAIDLDALDLWAYGEAEGLGA
jgi:uncharacterized damage-inducible protein DinB